MIESYGAKSGPKGRVEDYRKQLLALNAEQEGVGRGDVTEDMTNAETEAWYRINMPWLYDTPVEDVPVEVPVEDVPVEAPDPDVIQQPAKPAADVVPLTPFQEYLKMEHFDDYLQSIKDPTTIPSIKRDFAVTEEGQIAIGGDERLEAQLGLPEGTRAVKDPSSGNVVTQYDSSLVTPTLLHTGHAII
jgi:hypothetical protein